MSIPPEVLTDVAQYLEERDEGQRIKKLLFCLCKKYWENDPNVLGSQTLGTLLGELVVQKPTIEQLTYSLYKLVKTLNRPKVYAAVAKTILDQLGPVYTAYGEKPSAPPAAVPEPVTSLKVAEAQVVEHAPPPAITLSSPSAVADPQHLAGEIAHVLVHHQEQARIQKLIFAVARGYWENNLQAIDQVGLPNLILELRQRYPTPQELQAGFAQIVNNINKATLYLAIAKLIVQQMARLYTTVSAQAPASPPESEPVTSFMAPTAHVHDSAQQTSVVDLQALPVPPPPPPRHMDPIMTVLGAVVPSPPAIDLQAELQTKEYNLFELRSEIMQYSNPLRAKILLFSVLFQSWDEQGADWSMIRGYTLDDLVEQLLLSRQRPNDVEVKINAQAHRMADQESYQQTAQTLIKILKPLL